jgi:hypothetical protein
LHHDNVGREKLPFTGFVTIVHENIAGDVYPGIGAKILLQGLSKAII